MKKIIVSTAILALSGFGLTGCGIGGGANAASTDSLNVANLATTTTTAAPVALLKTTESSLGSIVTDNQGRTLYAFTKDPQFGASTCFDACATSWPAAQVSDQSLVGQGVDNKLIGAIVRKDGTKQLTLNGWPLYRFQGDGDAAGGLKGQGNKSVWYVVGTNGKLIKNAAPAATDTGAAANPSTDSSATKSGTAAGTLNSTGSASNTGTSGTGTSNTGTSGSGATGSSASGTSSASSGYSY